MDYMQALEHEPTRREAVGELKRHGSTWWEFAAWCKEHGEQWNAPGVLLGFLGYLGSTAPGPIR